MIKTSITLAILTVTCSARADRKYAGVYLDDKKIGYSSWQETPDQFNGQSATRTESHWDTDVKVGQFKNHEIIDSTSWSSPDNKLLKQVSNLWTNGAKTHMEATFGVYTVEIVVEVDGKNTHKSLNYPEGPVFYDQDRVIKGTIMKDGKPFPYWEFNAVSQTFEKFVLKSNAYSSFAWHGKSISGSVTQISVPKYHRSQEIYLDKVGENIFAAYGFGVVVVPEEKEKALAGIPTTTKP